ncbi:MAG: hypothetical protein AB4368_30205 [Xenococcaceae cyanobacterium]
MSNDIDEARRKMLSEAQDIEQIGKNPKLMALLGKIAGVRTAEDWKQLKKLWIEDSTDIDELILGFHKIGSPNFRTVGLHNFQLEKDSKFLNKCYQMSFRSDRKHTN